MARLLLVLLALGCSLGCARTRYRGPTLLATAGAFLAGGGAITYAAGDRDGSQAAVRTGAVTLGAGVGLLIASGVWASVRSQCQNTGDCLENEYCQQIYTTAGIYGHCIGR